MIMQKRPIRGEKYVIPSVGEVIYLDDKKDGNVEVILDNGKMTLIQKSLLDLPKIDTAFYEKITKNNQ